MAESKEELKSLLMKVKEESEKGWFKTQYSENEDHGIWSPHFMGNRWGNSGNSVRLYFFGTFTASSFRIWNSSTGIPSPPLALFVVMLSKAHLTSHSRTLESYKEL